MTVATIIEAAKKEKGWSTAELARRTGIKYSALQPALNDKRTITGLEFVKICNVLDLDVGDFEEL